MHVFRDRYHPTSIRGSHNVQSGNDQVLQRFDESTSAVLRAQYALAERFVNGVRIGVLGALAIASAF